MKRKEPVSHIMTTHLHTINETEELFDALNLIRKYKLRHLPVVRGAELRGIISSADINRLSFGNIFEEQEDADEAVFEMLTITQIMNKKVHTILPTTTIKEAAELFVAADYHCLPVVDDGKLVGIVTTTDIIKYMLEQY